MRILRLSSLHGACSKPLAASIERRLRPAEKRANLEDLAYLKEAQGDGTGLVSL
jgi:hypothetical protein